MLDAFTAYSLFARLGHAPLELAAIAYLDPKWRLIGMRHVAGERSRVRPAFRVIARDALALEATAVVMAHNHPGGDPTPSAADIAFTRDLARTLHAIGVALTDHLVLAGERWTSFRRAGLL